MTCREFADFLSDYLSDELPPDRREQFERHLRACPDCLNYLATFRRTIQLSRDAVRGDTDLTEKMPAQLVEAILCSRRDDNPSQS
jgi:anti-sigma factor RsiW